MKIVLIYRISSELNVLIISDCYMLGDQISEEKGKITSHFYYEATLSGCYITTTQISETIL